MSKVKQVELLLRGQSDTPALDARLFCAFYQGNPSEEQITDFVARRKEGEPVAKIIGQKGFWKRDFAVSPAVLDPRPDSETLIEAVLEAFPDKSKAYRALDVGSGSGCLILSLVDEFPCLRAVGADKSPDALLVAQKNDAERAVRWIERDFYEPSFGEGLGRFDIIVSNPPYIPSADIPLLEKSVSYDPILALDGGADGLDAYKALAERLILLIAPQGVVFFEIGQGQADDVTDIMLCHGWKALKQYKDLGGVVRVLSFERSE